ncbi:phytochelatin synthase family protein [Phyllobacterium endophyticum]|uniref:phytochelatin synthase family protein n=1 Tax=Phyllobacterium endophyticum TaxID=1149773 RepID=UPI0011CC58E2|nr:phytochelatin synthase family protein [Phyllobacterium endophyticum]TXR49024.1 phytochelatin synthase [Phyllobacterium endophyticum]
MKRRLIAALAVCAGLIGGAAILLTSRPVVSPQAIETSVIRTPDLMERAWRLPVAASFGSSVTFQSNASRCGPASIANVFRSLGEEETTEAKVLEDTGKCWTGFCIIGLTLDELAEIARTHTGRKVSVLRDLTPEQFHEHMRHANEPDRRYVVNFSREPIFGGGAGHHSPIGGYMEAGDLVFVLDVNENYRPWLIKRDRLFEAMNTRDGDRTRGLLLIE